MEIIFLVFNVKEHPHPQKTKEGGGGREEIFLFPTYEWVIFLINAS